MRSARAISRFIVLAFVLISLMSGVSSCAQKAKNDTFTVLSNVEGKVTILKTGTNEWKDGQEGMTLDIGDIVQSGSESSASITFFEGSTIELKAGTQVEISSLNIQKSGTTTILLKQKIGETISQVIKLSDPKSRYEIETISATAAVRGSSMVVTVGPSGATAVGNVEGNISIIAQGVEVVIPVGSHSVALPGQPPAEPVQGVRRETISTTLFADPVSDLFDKNGQLKTGEPYLDIVQSQVSLTSGLYTVHIELSEHCPQRASEPTTFIEWDFLIDIDKNVNTGTRWPLIGNDTGYDYMARMTLDDTKYGDGLLKVDARTWSDIDYIVAIYNWDKVGNIIDLYIPADAIGNPSSFNWMIAIRKYMINDPPNLPSISDKAPNDGHFSFP